MKLTKKELKKFKKDVLREKKYVWDSLRAKERKTVFNFSKNYKKFLDVAKTEREAVALIKEIAEESGFVDITKSDQGNRFYKVNKHKNIALAVIGSDPICDGVNIIGSHVDSPRLDLKQNPLFENTDLVFLKSHYYGGIKRYQWLNIPLALHGVIFRKDGSKLELTLGEKPSDPVFVIADLLPHLSEDQYSNTVHKAFPAEKLNVIIGSLPLDNKESDRFKLAVLHYLYKTYNIIEEDLVGAEIEVVPAGKARDIGFDKGLIGAYGHDDRVCAYTSLQALLEVKNPRTTAVAIFVDKEEIGSEGNTGAKSTFMKNFITDLLRLELSESLIGDCLERSCAISADVTCGINPDFSEVYEATNAAKLGYGVSMEKAGGAGKYYSNDTNAEFLAKLRKIFNDNNIIWQTGQVGSLEKGGGGTIAIFFAKHGMEIIDCGVPLLSMHSPMEIANKSDIYMAYKAYKVFYEN